MRYTIVDDRLVETQHATVHVSDLGLRRGYGVFEFFRVVSGVPLFLGDHLSRLAHSAALADLAVPGGTGAVRAAVRRLIEANETRDGGIQILLTGGPSDDGVTSTRPSLVLVPVAVPPIPTEPAPATLMTHRHVRELPGAKGTNYLTAMRLARTMRERGAADIVYHDDERVYEAARAGLALVRDGVFVTATEGVLASVTMGHVLPQARRRLAVEERTYTLDELLVADEVVMVGSGRGVVAVVAIDDRRIGDGAVGPVVRALFDDFRAHVDAYVAANAVEWTVRAARARAG